MSMQKMDKEFASKTLVGPFATKVDMVVAMVDLIRSFPGLTYFDVPLELVPVSPQFSVEESHAYQEDNVSGTLTQ